MPKVRSIGIQSAMIDGISGGRIATAFSPAWVSCKPRRRNHPITQNRTLPTKGARQPQDWTWSGRNKELINHADPEPRMNPIVVPAAVELLTMPRVSGDAAR